MKRKQIKQLIADLNREAHDCEVRAELWRDSGDATWEWFNLGHAQALADVAERLEASLDRHPKLTALMNAQSPFVN